jgi:hypothetical protein
MKEGDAELVPPGQAIPQSFEPCPMAPYSRAVGATHSAHMARGRGGGLSLGGGGTILVLVAHTLGDTILDILRADEGVNTWFVVMAILRGEGVLTLRGYDVRRVLIRIAFGRFARSGLLLGYYRNDRR